MIWDIVLFIACWYLVAMFIEWFKDLERGDRNE